MKESKEICKGKVALILALVPIIYIIITGILEVNSNYFLHVSYLRALCEMIGITFFSLGGLIVGIISLVKKEKNKLMPIISIVISSIMVIIYGGSLIIGLLSLIK